VERIRVRFADENGRVRESIFEAGSGSEIRQALAERGFFLLEEEVLPKSFAERVREFFSLGNRVPLGELVEFTSLLRTMLKAGLPLNEALAIILESETSGPLPMALADVRVDINEGVAFSRALSRHPDVFPDILVRTIVAGEKAGALEGILARLTSYFSNTIAVRRKLIAALIYPAVLMVVASLAVSYLLISVVPEFADLFVSLDVPLPAFTRFVLGIADFVGDWFVRILGVIALVVFLLVRYVRTPAGRLALDGGKLRVPILGRLEERFALSQFSRILATMVGGGLPLLESLHTVLDSLENRVIANRLRSLPALIERGDSCAKALRSVEGIPSMMTRMVHVGEEAGNLHEMLENLADRYDQEIDTLTSTLTSLIEPLLFLVMAGVVGAVIIALLIPVLTAASQIR
jgi:type IV pilus assembly protein PilC